MPILENEHGHGLSGHSDVSCELSQQSSMTMRDADGASNSEELCYEKVTSGRRPTAFCAGCHTAIYDQFFLSVAHEAWHCQCLKCQVCNQSLDCQISCYYKDGRILCKDDYIKRCRSRRTVCSVCNVTINADELVMRIGGNVDGQKKEEDLVYHLECFRCCLCSSVLRTGDHFGMRNDGYSVYCQQHFPSLTSPLHQLPAGHQGDNKASSPFTSPFLQAHHNENEQVPPIKKTRGRQRRKKLAISFDHDPPMERHVTAAGAAFMASVQQPPRPPLDNYIDPQNVPLAYNMSSDESSAEGSGTSGSLMMSCRQMTPLQMGHHPPRPDSSSPTSSQHHRAKRMRTSFKHQQLRSMKQYFQINHNPDAKDLKQLAQKTGLTKRVLQVWFQNARAKYRRSMMKQDPSLRSGDMMAASASPESSDILCHSPPPSALHTASSSPTFGQNSSSTSYPPQNTPTERSGSVLSPSPHNDYY